MTLRLILVLTILTVSHAAFAADAGIHSMVVGSKVLELVDTRQLTFKADGKVIRCAISPNGAYVAYVKLTDESFTVSIARSKGGSTTAFTPAIDRPTKPNDTATRPGKWFVMCTTLVWSPDSRLVALVSQYRKPMPFREAGSEDQTPREIETKLLLIQTDGKLKGSFHMQADDWRGMATCESMAFSPDARKIALSVHGINAGPWKEDQKDDDWLEIMDASTGRSATIYSNRDVFGPQILSWAKDGSAILCEDNATLIRISVPDGSVETLYEHEPVSDSIRDSVIAFSCNGKYFTNGFPDYTLGLSVTSIDTKQVIPIAKLESQFERWFSNGNLLLYSQRRSIKDDSDRRTRELRTLWLSSMAGHSRSSMCVALDADEDSATFSTDYRRMAYILDGRVHVAELEWRNPTAHEKVDAGLRLTEEEEKTILMENGKQIGLALWMRCGDYEGRFPDSDSYEADLRKAKAEGWLNRPGTGTNIFLYLGGGLHMNALETPGSTPVGELDAGYSWKIVIYADGHSEVVRK